MNKEHLPFSIPDVPLSLTIGYFDGLHLGHRLLLDETKRSPYQPTVLTFSKDWQKLKKDHDGLLLTEEEKKKMLLSLGIQEELILPFLPEILDASKEEFLSFLCSLPIRKLVVGEDFSFAKMGEGKADDLQKLKEKGIEVKILPLLSIENEKVSSTRIRELMKNKEIEKADRLLSYPFFYQGKVIHGYENGRKIGFPTANLSLEKDKFLLPQGVYQTKTTVDGKSYDSMTNIGSHPTIETLDHPIIETAIFDFNEDIYGKVIKVEFLRYLRDQKKFSSLMQLKEQLKRDQEECTKQLYK